MDDILFDIYTFLNTYFPLMLWVIKNTLIVCWLFGINIISFCTKSNLESILIKSGGIFYRWNNELPCWWLRLFMNMSCIYGLLLKKFDVYSKKKRQLFQFEQAIIYPTCFVDKHLLILQWKISPCLIRSLFIMLLCSSFHIFFF